MAEIIFFLFCNAGLDFQCVPPEKVVAVHGSIGMASCESCGSSVNFDQFCDDVKRNIKDIYNQDQEAPTESSPILCPSCKKPTVKPSTVLFGSSLPSRFFDLSEVDTRSADLLIVAGTSLVVSPANFLVSMVPDYSLRVIVNLHPVGQHLGVDYGPNSKRDFFANGNCDEVFLDLICYLGWFDCVQEFVNELPEQSRLLVQGRMEAIKRKMNV
jgi:NAD-dependent SIR2 family protein deacetylase